MIINFNRSTAFGLCLAQAALTVAVVLYFPSVRVETFTAHPVIANGTLRQSTADSHVIHSSSFSLALPFMILSCVAALFTTTTTSLIERGSIAPDAPYCHENLSETGLWDAMFWGYCTGAHALAFLVALSPGDSYMIALASILVVYFIAHACQPRSNESVSLVHENSNLLGYFSGVLIALYNLPDSHPGRTATIAVAVLLDYILAVGHTWDHVSTMDVVTNCRVFYTCSTSLCLAGLYGAWHDSLLMD
jgi:hypothetical protein